MKEEFEVVEIKKQTMKLKVNRTSSCHSCAANSSCGTGLLSKYFSHYSLFDQPLQKGVKIGDTIALEISSKILFYRAFQLYLLPLCALFLGGLLVKLFYSSNEMWQIIGAFIGFFFALSYVKYFAK